MAAFSEPHENGDSARVSGAASPSRIRRPRVPGVDKSVGNVGARAKGVTGGLRRAAATGRTAGRTAAARAGRTTTQMGRTAASGVEKTGGTVAQAGGTTASGVARTGRSVTSGAGALASKGIGTAAAAVRTGLGASLSFLVSRALLLLQLIKRLAKMALDALQGLANRLRERGASARRPDLDTAEDEENTQDSGGEDSEPRGRRPRSKGPGRT